MPIDKDDLPGTLKRSPAKAQRTYAETLEAWKTSCPRLSIWEDALADRLIRIEAGAVRLTPAGRTFLTESTLAA